MADVDQLEQALEHLSAARACLEESNKTNAARGPNHHFADGYDVHVLNIGAVGGLIERVERMRKAAGKRAGS